MPKQRKSDLLKQDVEAWNQLRRREKNVKLSLKGEDLSQSDLAEANLSGIDLRGADLQETNLANANFKGADLSGANLERANLKGANLSKAVLVQANLTLANLKEANAIGADLSRVRLNHATLVDVDAKLTNLRGAECHKTNFNNAYLTGANFTEAILEGATFKRAFLEKARFEKAILKHSSFEDAKLIEADFIEANLNQANFQNADLTEADLIQANLMSANFTNARLIGADLSVVIALNTQFRQAILTGACLEDWNINSRTNLDDIICEFIYLKGNHQERRPENGEFAPGDFSNLVQQISETIDLIFSEGIDWKAFLTSFTTLRAEYGEQNFSIQAMEKKSNDAFVVRLAVPSDIDRSLIETEIKELYQNQLAALEASYREQLRSQREQLEIYRKESADLLEITKLLAGRTTSPIAIESAIAAKQPDTVMNFNAPVGRIGSIEVGRQVSFSRHNLAEAAAEIQQLLDQLTRTYPSETIPEKMTVATKAIDRIEQDSTLKSRIITALKSGGTQALKDALEHPAAEVLLAAMEGWAADKE